MSFLKFNKNKKQADEIQRQFVASQAAAYRREQEMRVRLAHHEQEIIERRQHDIRLEEQRIREEELRKWNEEQEELRRQHEHYQKMARLRNTSPESLRHLRELMRGRYQLDIEIWNRRDVQYANRNAVMEQGRKADAILQEIFAIVDTWEESTFTPEEWRVARRIKELVFQPDKRFWEKNPPWS